MGSTIHYYPDALVVFLKSFKDLDVENFKPEDLLTASGYAKEIMSVQISTTVGANPCTFSLTLNDVANKFSVPDDPVQEVSNIRNNSEFQVKRDMEQRSYKLRARGGVSYYEFDGYKDGKSPWLSFEYGVLIDTETQDRCVMQYRRLPNGTVAERWAFDSRGRVIRFSDTYNEEFFTSPTSNGSSVTINVKNQDGVSHPRTFIFLKYSNSDFSTKYQASVTDQNMVGRCKIEPMDRVVIFLSRRFQKSSDGKYQVCEQARTELVQAFTGLVNTVQMSYSDTGNVVTVNGEDVTKWMRLSVVPLSPTAIPETDQVGGVLRFAAGDNYYINYYTNLFQGLTTPDLIRLLTIGSEGFEGNSKSKLHGLKNIKLRGIGTYTAAKTKNTSNENIVFDPQTGMFVVRRNNTDVSTFSIIDFKGMLGSLFSKSSVHVVDPTETGMDVYLAYNMNYKTSDSVQTEFKNRREICYSAAADSNFNFYADRKGHIWFHPPRYSNAWLLTQENDKLYIVDDDSIISYGFVEDDTNVYSACVVSSEPDIRKNVSEGSSDYNRGSYVDEMLMYKFGTKIITVSNPFISSLGGGSTTFSSEEALFYAKATLQKLLANKMQGQITITGRAEIDPGYPVYIPFRNMVYWVESVDHSLQFGGRYETVLHLSYGRKPWEVIPEIITQSFDMIHSTDGHIKLERDTSVNQPKTTNKGKRTSTRTTVAPIPKVITN
jgi:hypothetical protein